VGREILFLSSVFLIIGLSQFLIRDIIYDNPNNWSWHYLFEEIRNTFLVGILFTLILVPLNFMRLYTRHQKISQKFPPGEQKQDYRESENILIKTNLTADDFYLDPDQIIFARAEGNYLEIFLDKEEASKPLLKRVTLKKFEQQLNKYPFLVKTHRSYMVNLHKIVHMKGNAQGYRLKLNKHDQFIPVSRSMIEKFEEEIRRL
jgi:DNA-binding LytR/AlgR family response regulator